MMSTFMRTNSAANSPARSKMPSAARYSSLTLRPSTQPSSPSLRAGVQADLDACCKAAGLWPDLVISGHAHLYQRFTRTNPNGKKTPYIVSGSGGFAATNPMEKIPKVPFTTGDYTLEIKPIVEFGYLTIESDGNQISVVFKTAITKGVAVADSVSVDLKTGKLSSGSAASFKKSPTNTPTKKTKSKETRSTR
jgi:hypothetical protein